MLVQLIETARTRENSPNGSAREAWLRILEIEDEKEAQMRLFSGPKL
jgi:hypothetical protein